MMTPIYEGISTLLSIRTLNLPEAIGSDGDLDDLAIWKERRVAFVWLIDVDAHQRKLLVSCCLDV